jgi:hypothetical protein
MAKPTNATISTIEFDQDLIAARASEVELETDDEIYARLAEKFDMLVEMTKAVKAGGIRACIVSGPPGVGKSFGVESVLEKDGLFDTLGERKPRYEIIKGALSAIGLYSKLYEFSEKGSIIVFDDADNIFFDDLCLNLLKAALDSSAKRVISWNTDSRILRSEGIPDRFEFKGSVIFISNIKFEYVRSKKLKAHLDALESRCHYIDLQMDTPREKLLRIKQVVSDCGMLDKYEFSPEVVTEIIGFVEGHKEHMRELSLRTVLKTADLVKSFPNKWQSFAKTTLMKKAA